MPTNPLAGKDLQFSTIELVKIRLIRRIKSRRCFDRRRTGLSQETAPKTSRAAQ